MSQDSFVAAFEQMKKADKGSASDESRKVGEEFDRHDSNWAADVKYLSEQFSNPSNFVRLQASALIATVEMVVPGFELNDDVLPNVHDLLRDPVERNRINAMRILGWARKPKPHLTAFNADKILPLLDDESARVRKVAAEGLLITKPLPAEVLAAVVSRFQKDPEIQDVVIETIGKAKITQEPALALLDDQLTARSGPPLRVVLESLKALAAAGVPVNRSKIEAISKSETDESIRNAARAVLAAIERPAGVRE